MQSASDSSSGYWNLDSVQSLLRGILKIGGGYLLAKALADGNTAEAVIAGAVALVAIVWGVRHRAKSEGRRT